MVRVSLILFFLLIAMPTMAQTTNSPEAISAQNAADLHVVAQIGAALQGKLVWSPDSETLAVGTSDETVLYRPAESDQPIHRVEGSGDILFDQSGAVVTDAGRFDPATGEFIGEPIGFSPSGRYTYTSAYDGTQNIIYLRDTQTGEVRELSTGIGVGTPNLTFSHNETQAIIVFVYENWWMPDTLLLSSATFQLWDVPHATLIMVDDVLHETFNGAGFNDDDSVFFISSIGEMEEFIGVFHEIHVYDGQIGEMIYQANDATNGVWGSFVLTSTPDNQLSAILKHTDGASEIVAWRGRELNSLQPTYLGGSDNEQPPTPIEKPYGLIDIRFSPDSRYLVAQTAEAGSDSLRPSQHSFLLVWDVDTLHEDANPNFELHMPDDNWVRNFILSDDGKLALLYSSSNNGANGALFNMDDGSLIASMTNMCQPLRFLKDSRHVLAECYRADRQIRESIIYDPFEGVEITLLPPEYLLSPDDRMVAHWDGGHVRVTDAYTQALVVNLNPIPDYVGKIAQFDAERGAAEFENGTTQCLNIAPETECDAPTSLPHTLVTPDGQFQIRFISHVIEKRSLRHVTTMRIRNQASGELVSSINIGSSFRSIALSPDGSQLAMIVRREMETSNVCQSSLAIFDLSPLTSGEAIERYGLIDIDFCQEDIVSLEIIPHQQLLVVDIVYSACGHGCEYFPWIYFIPVDSLPSSDEIVELESLPIAQVYEITEAVFTPDFTLMAALDAPHSMGTPQSRGFYLWWVEAILAGEYTNEADQPIAPMVTLPGASQLTLSPDGSVLAVRGTDAVGLWDVAGLLEGESEPLILIDIEGAQEIGFSPDGTLLLISTTNRAFAYGVS